jgi:hypothetical protein
VPAEDFFAYGTSAEKTASVFVLLQQNGKPEVNDRRAANMA